MKSSRITYLDIYKGILILMVVYGHIAYAVSKYADGCTNGVYQFLGDVAMNWMAPYYMAAFFVATGYCMNLAKPFLSQLRTDALTLLLPGIVVPVLMDFVSMGNINLLKIEKVFILHGGSCWFLVALFLAKQWFWLLQKLPTWCGVILALGGAMFGILVFSNQIPEYWYVWHALVLSPFLFVGSYLSKYKKWIPKAGIPCGVTYILLIMLLKRYGHTIPAFCSTINFGLYDTPYFFLLTIMGSVVIMSVARFINKQSMLEYFGRNSLVIYLTHFTFFAIAIPFFRSFVRNSQDSTVASLCVFVFLFIGSLLWSSAWIKIFDSSYFCWLIGKKHETLNNHR